MKTYNGIKAWGFFLGHPPSQINRNIQLAVDSDAPEDSVFLSPDYKWVPLTKVTSLDTLLCLEDYALKHKWEDLQVWISQQLATQHPNRRRIV